MTSLPRLKAFSDYPADIPPQARKPLGILSIYGLRNLQLDIIIIQVIILCFLRAFPTVQESKNSLPSSVISLAVLGYS